ncbi:MAG: glycoside hydrolase [Actinomycetota bacterium]|nr:glycoside hydrolase [Actinomycetota bacterium]
MRATRLATALATSLALASAAVASAGPAPGPAAEPVGPASEAQLTFDPHYAEGEPSIAVNPRNPSNIIVTFLANTGFGAYGAQSGQVPPTTRDHEQTIQGCDYVVTFDRGRTWTRSSLPITSFQIDPTRPNCSDTLVVFDPHGVAYVIGSSFQFPTFAAGQGDFRMIHSTDGGRTWSKPTVVSPALLGSGSDPAAWKGARFYDDREFMALDASTGTLYVNGTQGRADGNGSAGNMEYLTASTDGGRTWSDATAVGTANAVQLAAAFGTVAFTSPAPANSTRECACDDFLVSTDGGRTVLRRPSPVPGSSTANVLGGASTVADPRHKNHFVVMAADAAGNLLTFRTANAGRSWTHGATLAVPGRGVSKIWLAFSPGGVLGVGWRATHSDGTYAFYGAVSYDGGRSFTMRRLSAADSPATDKLWVAGDDTSAVWLTDDRFYATWGDWRGGSLQTWWGGFALRHPATAAR